MTSDQNPIDPTIKDVEAFLRLPIQEAKEPYDACEHKQVTLDQQARTVTCTHCAKQVDAFWYLTLLAREWKTRSYFDTTAKEAAERLRKRDAEDMARGHIFARPVTPGPARDAWDVYTAFYSREPYAIYYGSKEWRARPDDGGSSESVDFIRKLLGDRVRVSGALQQLGGAASIKVLATRLPMIRVGLLFETLVRLQADSRVRADSDKPDQDTIWRLNETGGTQP